MRRVRRTGLLVGAALVAASVGGYGYAAVTATNQTYTGCLSKGLLTKVAVGASPRAACTSDQTQISWSKTGPQGKPGVPGPPGPKGDPGTVAGAPCTRS